MKKTFIVFGTVTLILAIMCSGFTSSADSTFSELWEEKRVYEKEKGYVATGAESYIHMFYMDYPERFSEEFLLFTEQGKALTYEFVSSYEGGLDMLGDYVSGGYVACPQLSELRMAAMNEGKYALTSNSSYRRIIQELGITSDELRAAYKTMQEAPEQARELLPFLSDAQFDQFVENMKECSLPPNFVIEAACMKDDSQGNALMCIPGTVYVPEWEGCVSMVEFFDISCKSNGLTVDIFDSVDMTTPMMGAFIEDLKTVKLSMFNDVDSPDGRTPAQKLEYLESARESQLAAAETGDGAVYSVAVLALAIPALAATLILRRKKRI